MPVAIGSIIRSYEQSFKSVHALMRSVAFPVGVDCPGDGRAAPWADRAVAYLFRQALTNHRSRHGGHFPILRFRLCGTVLQRFYVQPMRRAAVYHTASCAWPGPMIACAI